MASHDSLITFDDAWNSLLRAKQLPFLHTRHALRPSRSLSPVIRSQSSNERCEALTPFVDCILNHLELGIVVAVDVKGYSKWTPGAKKRVGGTDDPAYFAFMQAATALKKHACRAEDRISIMCDDDEGTAWNFYQLYRRFKKIDPDLQKQLASLSFSNDQMFPALQAADLIAALIRLESKKAFGYHPHNFGPLVFHLLKPNANQKLTWIGLIGDSGKLDEIRVGLEKIAD